MSREKKGIRLIAEERQRQILVERWSDKHDDQHTDSSLVMAAISYATPPKTLKMVTRIEQGDVSGGRGECPVWGDIPYDVPTTWPDSWQSCWWNPGVDDEPDRIRDLVKAGALIAAEIDRLQRIEARESQE